MTDRELAGCAGVRLDDDDVAVLTTDAIAYLNGLGTRSSVRMSAAIMQSRTDYAALLANYEALLSRAPSRDAERLAENGPYRALNAGGKVVVESEDFTHDVWLYVTGDFGSDGQHMIYAEWIADTLNAAIAAAERENHG